MATIANIVLPDAQATPVNHTFSPAGTPVDESKWEDRSAGTYLGFNKLWMKLRRPSGPITANGSGRNLRLNLRVETPKMEVISNSSVSGIAPAPTVSYRPTAEVEFTFPERCSLQDRKDILKYLIGYLQNAVVTSAVENYEVAY